MPDQLATAVTGLLELRDAYVEWEFPVHPADAPPAVAVGPTSFQPIYPGAVQYLRPDAPGYVLLHDRQKDIIKVLLPGDGSGSLARRTVGHTVAIIDGDLPDAIAAAAAAVDHMMGRGR